MLLGSHVQQGPTGERQTLKHTGRQKSDLADGIVALDRPAYRPEMIFERLRRHALEHCGCRTGLGGTVGRSDAVLFALALHLLDFIPIFALGMLYFRFERMSIKELKEQHEDEIILDRISEDGTYVEKGSS